MKVLFWNLEIKKVPKQDLSEQVRYLSEIVEDQGKRIQANYRAGEALRKRFERAGVPGNGTEPAEQAYIQPARSVDLDQFNTGMPWPEE